MTADRDALLAAEVIFKNLLRWDGLPQTKADRIANWLDDAALAAEPAGLDVERLRKAWETVMRHVPEAALIPWDDIAAEYARLAREEGT